MANTKEEEWQVTRANLGWTVWRGSWAFGEKFTISKDALNGLHQANELQKVLNERFQYTNLLEAAKLMVAAAGGQWTLEGGIPTPENAMSRIAAALDYEIIASNNISILERLVARYAEARHLDGCAEASMHYRESALGQERWECGNCRASSWREALSQAVNKTVEWDEAQHQNKGTNICRKCNQRKEMLQDESICYDCRK